MISNCGHDEHRRYSGGQAGDQTHEEWEIIDWYSRPWSCVIRFDKAIRESIARNAERAAKNDLIGYDQDQRNTYIEHLEASGWDASRITVPCEADCSAGVTANLIAAGYEFGIPELQNIDPDATTRNLKSICKNAGAKILTDSKYLTSDEYLLRGDILLLENHHVATNLDNGAKADINRYEVGWHKDTIGWWYADSGQTYYHDCWKIINNHWYYFDAGGYIYMGWHQIEGKWYYFDDSKDEKYNGALWHGTNDQQGSLEIWNVL